MSGHPLQGGLQGTCYILENLRYRWTVTRPPMATNLSDSYLQLCYETGRHTKWRHFIFWYVSLWQYSWCCLRVIWSTTAVKNFVAVEHWLIIAAYMDYNFMLTYMKWIYKMLTRHFVLVRHFNSLLKFTKIILVL